MLGLEYVWESGLTPVTALRLSNNGCKMFVKQTMLANISYSPKGLLYQHVLDFFFTVVFKKTN